jgi:TLC domain
LLRSWPVSSHTADAPVSFIQQEHSAFVQAIPSLLFWEVRRKDFAESLAHHVATLTLIIYSYCIKSVLLPPLPCPCVILDDSAKHACMRPAGPQLLNGRPDTDTALLACGLPRFVTKVGAIVFMLPDAETDLRAAL